MKKYVSSNSTVSINNRVTENNVYTRECILAKIKLFIFNCKSLSGNIKPYRNTLYKICNLFKVIDLN